MHRRNGAREVYAMPLATIRVPLREADADITLALQPLVDRCYRMGGYWKSDQTNVPGPPLESSDEAWVSEQVKAVGLGE